MKRLYRSDTNKTIAGVCGGIAEYFEVDPTIIRLATALACLISGVIPLLIGYILAWVIVPRRTEP